jgi:hypothetical protein
MYLCAESCPVKEKYLRLGIIFSLVIRVIVDPLFERSIVLFCIVLLIYLYLVVIIVLFESANLPEPTSPQGDGPRVDSQPPQHPTACVDVHPSCVLPLFGE